MTANKTSCGTCHFFAPTQGQGQGVCSWLLKFGALPVAIMAFSNVTGFTQTPPVQSNDGAACDSWIAATT